MSDLREVDLRIGPCTRRAAEYAVKTWHYSRRMPVGKLMHFGVWERGRFVGAVVFGRGASAPFYRSWSLQQTEACELVRVALLDRSVGRETETTRVVAIALRELRRHAPNIHVVFSFADLDQGHEGVIYRAGNWRHAGISSAGESNGYDTPKGYVHSRTAGAAGISTLAAAKAAYGPSTRVHVCKGKHRFFLGLTKKGRKMLDSRLGKPRTRSGDAPVIQTGEGGSTPTPRLHPSPAEDQGKNRDDEP